MTVALNVALLALSGGFLVALATSLLWAGRKARQRPGGSLLIGVLAALVLAPSIPMYLLGAACGLAGWLCAFPLFGLKKEKD